MKQREMNLRGWVYPEQVYIVVVNGQHDEETVAPTKDIAIAIALAHHNDPIGNTTWEQYVERYNAKVEKIAMTEGLKPDYDWNMKHYVPNREWKDHK